MTSNRRLVLFGVAALFGAGMLPLPARALDPGDSNRDLRVSAADLTTVIDILLGDPANNGADANRDGFVLPDDLDATVLRLFGRPLVFTTATPTPTRTSSATPTRTNTPTAATPTRSPTGVVPPSATSSATASPTRPLGITPTPSPSPLISATPSRSVGPRTGTPTASPTPTATGGARTLYCSSLPTPLPIPDGNDAGVANDIVIADGTEILDLNVRLRIEHMYVGDLFVTLTHVNTKTQIPLLDGSFCDMRDIDCTFDDDAARFVEDVCGPLADSPAIDGGIIPTGILGDFTGESIAGTWRLAIADLAAEDTGSLVEWCLEVNSTAPSVTEFTCDGLSECVLPLDQPFILQLGFIDPDANAVSYEITTRDGVGRTFDIADTPLDPGTGGGTSVEISLSGFSCDDPPCEETQFEFFAVVRDASGFESPFAMVPIRSLATGTSAAEIVGPAMPSRPGSPRRS